MSFVSVCVSISTTFHVQLCIRVYNLYCTHTSRRVLPRISTREAPVGVASGPASASRLPLGPLQDPRATPQPTGVQASARVCGVQPKCKPTFFWGGWQKIVAQIRGVFRKMITNTPPGGQNLAQNGVFTPRFRLHTGVTRLLDVFFDRASVFFEVGAIPVLLILGTIPFRPRVLTLHVTA